MALARRALRHRRLDRHRTACLCTDGLVARALSARSLVLLGEIRFALYLVHSPIAQILFAHPGFTRIASMATQMALYWALSLLAAWGMWSLIEKPGRELIVSFYDRRRAKAPATA